MTKNEFAARLKHACAAVTAAEQELTDIDSKFGDADHGLTMTKIAGAIAEAVDEAEGGIQSMLDDAAMAVMALNGGSAVPLWNTWLDGMQEGAPEGDEVDAAGIQAIFAKALEELDDMSGAKVGDKTMMDALIPASEAIASYTGSDENELFAAAAKAAAQGAENSKNFPSKFGRAKSYGDNMASITVKSTDATHPQNGMSFGDLGETDLMEIGAGQHGEGGGVRVPMLSSKETVATVAEALCKNLDLKAKDIEVVASMVGEILTVQEAGGFQMNIAKWDEETIRLWNTPCHTPRTARSDLRWQTQLETRPPTTTTWTFPPSRRGSTSRALPTATGA